MRYRLLIFGFVVVLCLLSGIGLQSGAIHAQDAVTDTPVIQDTLPPTNTPRPTITPFPTFTPTPKATPIPARLCTDCNRVRLRATPGTAGDVVMFLTDQLDLLIIGRTSDDLWVQISTTDETGKPVTGWVSAQYIRGPNQQQIDTTALNALPVVAEAVNLTPSPTSQFGTPGWLSGVDAHTRAIFLKGQTLGNRANVFSKVGDSITYSDYFLKFVGWGNYQLGAYGSLAGVIGYYSVANARTGNSFVNQTLAAAGGWSTNQLLSPGLYHPEICGSQSPLVCEYTHVKPAIAIIMIGTNDSGSGSIGPFEANLRQIVQTSLDMGIIPVLSTIPPRPITADQAARVNLFNQSIRGIAVQYDVPLMDYYSQMLSAPDQGIGPDHLHPSVPADGFVANFAPDHLQYGYNIRNLITLQTLDVLWRYLS